MVIPEARVRHYVIIPAAGSGSRMGAGCPKQYLPLLGIPLIHHTLGIFSAHPAITAVYVVLARDDTRWKDVDAPSVKALRCGGATRAQTVLNGLRAIENEAAPEDWVLVHDAARPCLSQEKLDALLTACADDPVGGLLAVPVADTLKRANAQGRVAQTEAREGLWRAQTPQMFRYGLLCEALAARDAATATDEAQAVERLGLAPKLVPGDSRNLKITYPEDQSIAESILGEHSA